MILKLHIRSRHFWVVEFFPPIFFSLFSQIQYIMKVKDFYELSIPLVLDGGLATELERTHGKNLSTKLWSSACLYQDPASIREVHLSYFRAGADIASTCRLKKNISKI